MFFWKGVCANVVLMPSLRNCNVKSQENERKDIKFMRWDQSFDRYCVREPFLRKGNQITFILLSVHTYINVFMGSVLRICQYKNHQSSHILQTGPLNCHSLWQMVVYIYISSYYFSALTGRHYWDPWEQQNRNIRPNGCVYVRMTRC